MIHSRNASTSRSIHDTSRLPLDGLELLESRQMLAGTVNMIVNGAGDLILNGDAQNNDVEISMVIQSGEFVGVVRGLNGTTIRLNGQAASSQLFTLVEAEFDPISETRTTMRDVRVSLRGGDDSLRILPWVGAVSIGINIGRDLIVNMGAGQDQFEYRGTGGVDVNFDGVELLNPYTFVFDDVRILGQSGDDVLELRGVTVVDTMVLNSGTATTVDYVAGGDAITVADSVVTGAASVTGGAGGTRININTLFAAGNLTVRAGGGRDLIDVDNFYILGDTRLDLGAGVSDSTEFMTIRDGRLLGDLNMTAGGGDQFARWRQTLIGFGVGGTTNVRLGGGNDQVLINPGGTKFFEGNVVVNLGGGDDILLIAHSTFMSGNLSATLGGGSDRVRIAGAPAVRGNVLVNGGGGTDVVTNRDLLVVGGSSTWISIDDV